jgi:hypothetical protein
MKSHATPPPIAKVTKPITTKNLGSGVGRDADTANKTPIHAATANVGRCAPIPPGKFENLAIALSIRSRMVATTSGADA